MTISYSNYFITKKTKSIKKITLVIKLKIILKTKKKKVFKLVFIIVK